MFYTRGYVSSIEKPRGLHYHFILYNGSSPHSRIYANHQQICNSCQTVPVRSLLDLKICVIPVGVVSFLLHVANIDMTNVLLSGCSACSTNLHTKGGHQRMDQNWSCPFVC